MQLSPSGIIIRTLELENINVICSIVNVSHEVLHLGY
jgi:hypothetical protein